MNSDHGGNPDGIAMGPEGHNSRFQDLSNLHRLIHNILPKERQNDRITFSFQQPKYVARW